MRPRYWVLSTHVFGFTHMKNFELVQTERRAVMEVIANGLKQATGGRRIESTDGYLPKNSRQIKGSTL